MGLRRPLAAVGAALSVGVAAALDASLAAVGAGCLGAVTVHSADRGTVGLAASSLALAAAALVLGTALSAAAGPIDALGSLFVALGVGGSLAAAVGGGRIDTLLGAWTALAVVPVALVGPWVVATPPTASLVGARVTAFVGPVAVVVAVVVAVGAGWAALENWSVAELPAWPLTVGPAAFAVGFTSLAVPGVPAFGRLLSGDVLGAPTAYAAVWAGVALVGASALSATVAADDSRFRRLPAWLAVATGPLSVTVAVRSVDGVFIEATTTAVPPSTAVVGALAGTAPAATVGPFFASVVVSGVALAVTVPTLLPGVRTLVTGRPAGVGTAGLVVAVALSPSSSATTALLGALALLGGLLLVGLPTVEPPPRTTLRRTGIVASGVGAGAVLAASLGGAVGRSDPGVGGVFVLAGVVALGVALR